jgi:hypothetical protein
MLPVRTVNDALLDVPVDVVTTKFPVAQLEPSCTTIF